MTSTISTISIATDGIQSPSNWWLDLVACTDNLQAVRDCINSFSGNEWALLLFFLPILYFILKKSFKKPLTSEKVAQSPSIHHNLPARNHYFVNRDKEIKQMLVAIKEGKNYKLHATGGMGKSSIVIEGMYRLLEAERGWFSNKVKLPKRFADGIYFHPFYRESSVAKACKGLCHFLGAKYRSDMPLLSAQQACQGKRLLVILDGMEDINDVHRLRDLSDTVVLLSTTRNSQQLTEIEHDEVFLLSEKHSHKLLRKFSKDSTFNDIYQKIVDYTGGYPLTLYILGQAITDKQLDESNFESIVSNTQNIFDVADERYQRQSVNAVADAVFNKSSATARQLYATLGRLAFTDIDKSWLRGYFNSADKKQTQLITALQELAKYHLIHIEDEQIIISYRGLYNYAGELDYNNLDNLADYWVELFEHSRQDLTNYQLSDALLPHLQALVDRTIQAKFTEQTLALVDVINPYLLQISNYTAAKAILEKGLQTATDCQDKKMQGIFLGNLGLVYVDLGEVDKAIEYYEQALAISQEIKDPQGEGNHLGNLGSAYARLGKVEKAIKHYEQAVAISREIKDRQGEGNHLGNLGLAYYRLGEEEKAIEHYEQALTISREIKDRQGEGSNLGNLGLAYYRLSQEEKAIEYYEQALLISREIKDRQGEGSNLGNLGNAYHRLGQVEKAIVYYEQALLISREIKDRQGEGNRLGNLGLAYRSLGKVGKAIVYYEQALTISREIKDRQGEGNHLGNLGNAYRHLSEVEKAIVYYEQALLISREIKDRQSEENRLGNLGLAYYRLGEEEKAIEHYEQALTISREIKDRQGEGNHLSNLGNAYADLGDITKAIEYTQQAIAIFEAIKSPNVEVVKNNLQRFQQRQ